MPFIAKPTKDVLSLGRAVLKLDSINSKEVGPSNLGELTDTELAPLAKAAGVAAPDWAATAADADNYLIRISPRVSELAGFTLEQRLTPAMTDAAAELKALRAFKKIALAARSAVTAAELATEQTRRADMRAARAA